MYQHVQRDKVASTFPGIKWQGPILTLSLRKNIYKLTKFIFNFVQSKPRRKKIETKVKFVDNEIFIMV